MTGRTSHLHYTGQAVKEISFLLIPKGYHLDIRKELTP